MSAQFHTEAAARPRTAQAPSIRRPTEPGDVAFDRWLKNELGRLYDATLLEPVPEQLSRLLDLPPPKDSKPGPKR